VVRWGIWNVLDGMTPADRPIRTPSAEAAIPMASSMAYAISWVLRFCWSSSPALAIHDAVLSETWGYANLLELDNRCWLSRLTCRAVRARQRTGSGCG